MSEHVIDPPRIVNAASFPAPEALNRHNIVAPLLANVSEVMMARIIENRRRGSTGIAAPAGTAPQSQGRAPERETRARAINFLGPFRI